MISSFVFDKPRADMIGTDDEDHYFDYHDAANEIKRLRNYIERKQMKKTINVIPVGSKVVLTEDVIGTVESVTIYSEDYILYNCSWWNGRSLDTQTFRANNIDIVPVGEERLSIGFGV